MIVMLCGETEKQQILGIPVHSGGGNADEDGKTDGKNVWRVLPGSFSIDYR